MSSNIFDLFNSSKILDKHGKKIHLKIAKGSITWDKLGDDVKRRILGIEANIDSLYNYVRQLVPDMNYHSVTLVEAVGIRYIDNHQSIIIDGQNYSIIVETKEHYNLSDVIVTIGSDAYSLSDIESMEDKFTVDSYTETRLSFTVLNVTDNIRIEGVAEESACYVTLEPGSHYMWVDAGNNPAQGFYIGYNETNTYYIVIDTGWSLRNVTFENCSAEAKNPDSQDRIPVEISNVIADATVGVSLMENVIGISKRTPITLSNVKVLIKKENDADFSEIDFSDRFTVPRDTSFTLRLEPNEHYYLPSNYSAGYSIVSGADTDEEDFGINSETNYYEASFDGNEDVILFGDAALLKPRIINNTEGGFIFTKTPNKDYYDVNDTVTIQLTIPQGEYTVKTQPSITGISGATFTQSGNTYTASVTIGESDITINGVIEEVLPKIYYGIIPRTLTGFNADTINNGNGTVSELVNNNYINLQNLTEVDSDITQQQLFATPLDYIICLIDVTLGKKSMVYNEVTQNYDLYTSGFGSNYFYNGESTITYSSSGHTYKVYCQMAQSSYNIKISIMNN